jgi:ubiquinone/menaquinone biosynthesis C-methylase UbiE
MDEQEMDRIDMAHAKYFMLLEKKRWLAPIPANPQKVLDLACGTGQPSTSLLHKACSERIILIHLVGIWSIDFADAHPSAHVTNQLTVMVRNGTDL